MVILVKPGDYDDEGRSSNGCAHPFHPTRSPLYTVSRETALNRPNSGPNVDLDIYVYDETNTRIRPDRLARMINAGNGMVHCRIEKAAVSLKPYLESH